MILVVLLQEVAILSRIEDACEELLALVFENYYSLCEKAHRAAFWTGAWALLNALPLCSSLLSTCAVRPWLRCHCPCCLALGLGRAVDSVTRFRCASTAPVTLQEKTKDLWPVSCMGSCHDLTWSIAVRRLGVIMLVSAESRC